VDVGIIPRYAVKASNPLVNTAAPPYEEPRTTWDDLQTPRFYGYELSLGGHTQNTDGNDVRLRAEAHMKGYRGSTYEEHPSTRRGRIAGQVSPLQSDSGPRRADTNFTATISRANYHGRGQRTCQGLLVLWSIMSGGWQAAVHRAGTSVTAFNGSRCLRQGIQSKGEPAAPPYKEPRTTGDDLRTTRFYGQYELPIHHQPSRLPGRMLMHLPRHRVPGSRFFSG
jgi:hypothetical protein